jgi:RsiW-degrading membrane proteinase PrsW (M82 family)
MESPPQPSNYPTAQPSFDRVNPEPSRGTQDKPNPPTAESPTILVGGVSAIVIAAFLLLCGACSALLYLVSPLVARSTADTTQANVVWGSLAGLGGFLGALLVWQGVNAVRGRASCTAARSFPPVIVFVVVFLFALVVGLGTLMLSGVEASLAAAYFFPPWHVIAASVLPLAFLAYATRRLGTMSSLRALVTSFGWGVLGGTLLAFLLEVVIGIALVIVAAVALSLTPEGEALLRQWQMELASGLNLDEPAQVSRLFSNPVIIAGVLFYLAIVIPLVEESVKTLVVAFADPRRTRLADAVLWGIGAGAGFALFENAFNAGAVVATWAFTMLLRVGATAIHVANGATMGRGWYAARVERRWSRLFIAYVVCVFLHALWNAAAVVISGNAVFLMDNANAPLETQLPAGMLILALIALLLGLTFLSLIRIAFAVRSAREPLQEICTKGEHG